MPFRERITAINNTQVDNDQYIDIMVQMYNSTERSGNFAKTSGGLFQYYRVEPTLNMNDAIANFTNDHTISSLKFKEKITGQKDNDGTKCAEIMVPLCY